MIKAVLFDLDGTLNSVDNVSFGRQYYAALAKHFKIDGITPQEVAYHFRQAVRKVMFAQPPINIQDVYFDYIKENLGIDFVSNPQLFDEFLEKKHGEVFDVFEKIPCADSVVKAVKAQGLRVVLATNPIFLRKTIDKRMEFTGVDPQDFEVITTMDWCNATKPHPEYYLQIAEKIGVKPSECLMVGNDLKNDMVARLTGMKVLLLPRCLENINNEDYSGLDTADLSEVPEYVRRLNGGKDE